MNKVNLISNIVFLLASVVFIALNSAALALSTTQRETISSSISLAIAIILLFWTLRKFWMGNKIKKIDNQENKK